MAVLMNSYRIISMFLDTDIYFDEFDDVVIRILVGCIKIMKLLNVTY